MANIDSQISKIRTAERGEDVRDSIISALRDINNDVPADMSNPTRVTGTMPPGTDLTINIDPPKLVNQVYIQQAGSGGKNTTLVDAKIVDNGKYPSEDKDDGGGSYDPDKEIRYYKSVDVNVDQLANKVVDLEEEITQNGSYSAFDFGADGLRSFTVNVNPAPVSGQFEVTFYDTDRTTVLYTELVPAYGNADYHGPYIPQDPGGKTFVGWNPSPVNVTRNMKCYPNFVSQQMVPGEIGPDWDIIVADGGAQYPIGSYKSLYYSATFKNSEIEAFGFRTGTTYDKTITFSTIMTKVAEGEDGSKSTWLSLPTTMEFNSGWVPDWSSGKYYRWPDRWERKWMQCLYTKFSPIFLQHIKPVIKYTQGSTAYDPPFEILTTQDTLWMTSIKEVCIDNAYWENDLNVNLHYDQPFDHARAKAKYYDGLPLCLAYMNQAGLTPKERDELFYFNSSQYSNSWPSMRDVGDHFLDRRIGFTMSSSTATYTNPTTGEEESARFLTDRGVPNWASGGWIFGFCLV